MIYLRNRKKDILPYALLIIFYLISIILNAKFGETVLESDMSSEIVLANVLNREGSMISKNWFYGSEIRVFHMQLLYKCFLCLFPNNWYLVRLFTQSILMLMLMLSSLFCFNNIGFYNKIYIYQQF